jgi:hypothetical protein
VAQDSDLVTGPTRSESCATDRLAEIVTALEAVGLISLFMGGHAVQFYGLDRNTADYALHLAPPCWDDLPGKLSQAPLFAGTALVEGPELATERLPALSGRHAAERSRRVARILAGEPSARPFRRTVLPVGAGTVRRAGRWPAGDFPENCCFPAQETRL